MNKILLMTILSMISFHVAAMESCLIKNGMGDIKVVEADGTEYTISAGNVLIINKKDSWSYHMDVYSENGSFVASGQSSIKYVDATCQKIDPLKLIEGIAKNSHLSEKVRGQQSVDTAGENCEKNQSSAAPVKSLRPVPRPANLSRTAAASPPTPSSSNLSLKPEEDLENYIDCYTRMKKYKGRYPTLETSIDNAIDEYMKAMPEKLRPNNREKMKSIFTCLILRESSFGWDTGNSTKGARGLGQFTTDAQGAMINALNWRIKPAGWKEQKEKEFAGKTKDLAYIRKVAKNSDTADIIQKIWKGVPIPKGKRPTPNAAGITMDFLGKWENHQAVMALSMGMIVKCQMNFEFWGYKFDAPEDSILACAGAYNMGDGGFKKNALGSTKKPQKIENWVANLKASSSGQKNETVDHIVSVKRCADKGKNYPMCGTGTNFCKQQLSNTNSCVPSNKVRCTKEKCE